MIDLNVFICSQECTVGTSPVGLFWIEEYDEIICISEYSSGQEGGKTTSRDAYIVLSGENYCGGDSLKGRPLVLQ